MWSLNEAAGHTFRCQSTCLWAWLRSSVLVFPAVLARCLHSCVRSASALTTGRCHNKRASTTHNRNTANLPRGGGKLKTTAHRGQDHEARKRKRTDMELSEANCTAKGKKL
ncbi:hypothetical protein WMY93_008835 [Mugilogobius chulae]|uniref:Secreted protein n=1 Tax=Mugilogobius chulae TaxID=88201 RepID=A0AAW0P9S4_9GOBI